MSKGKYYTYYEIEFIVKIFLDIEEASIIV